MKVKSPKSKFFYLFLCIIMTATSIETGWFSTNRMDNIVENSDNQWSDRPVESASIQIDNMYDFSKGTMRNVSINEQGKLSLELDKSKTSIWVNSTPSILPSERRYQSMAYDTDSNLFLMFGGISGTETILNETWVYDLSCNQWTNMKPKISPSARFRSSLVYDSNSHMFLLFGGDDKTDEDPTWTFSNETWAYDLETNVWKNLIPQETPSARRAHAMVYDSTMNKVILYGGVDINGYNNETWIYDTKTNVWVEKITPMQPTARYRHAMVYDEFSNKVIMFGGGDGSHNDETWTYDLQSNTWLNQNPSVHPTGRSSCMVYDPHTQQTLLFGGYDGSADSETWKYDLVSNIWTNLAPLVHPQSRWYHSMGYDVREHSVILFGGYDVSFDFGDTWSYDQGRNTWIDMDQSIRPSKRYGHTTVYDPINKKSILFGGWDGELNDETWVYDMERNLWTEMSPTIRPLPRYSHTAVFDLSINKMVLFGGRDTDDSFNETWIYDISQNTWTLMQPLIRPSSRHNHAMIYDSSRREVVLFGGYADDGHNNETWIYLSLQNSWVELHPTVLPEPREAHTMVYDSTNKKIILFGGNYDDTWIYDGDHQTWTNMAPSSHPDLLYFPRMVFDISNQEILMFGGRDLSTDFRDEMWKYNLMNNTWTEIHPDNKPNARYFSSIVYDSNAHKIMLFGGYNGSLFDGTWIYHPNLYYDTGSYTSPLLDMGSIQPFSAQLSWNPHQQPVNTPLNIQIEISNSTLETDFIRTDLHNTSFTFDGTGQYLRYHILLESNKLHLQTPTVEKVYLEYQSNTPSYLKELLTYLEGNATLVAQINSDLGENAILIEALLALANQNAAYLISLNSSLSGNITLLRNITNQLGISVGDSDYDGLDDLDELNLGTNLLCSDTDCDNLNDAFEVKIGTNPLLDDTDGDGYYDGIEVASATDPLDPDDYPSQTPPTNPDTTSNTTSTDDPSISENERSIAGFSIISISILSIGVLFIIGRKYRRIGI